MTQPLLFGAGNRGRTLHKRRVCLLLLSSLSCAAFLRFASKTAVQIRVRFRDAKEGRTPYGVLPSLVRVTGVEPARMNTRS